MALSILSPELAYATKKNIAFPGTAAQATAAEVAAAARINDAYGMTLASFSPGTITVAS